MKKSDTSERGLEAIIVESLINDAVYVQGNSKVDVRDIKVEDISNEEITDDLDSSEDEQELDDSVEEVLDEE